MAYEDKGIERGKLYDEVFQLLDTMESQLELLLKYIKLLRAMNSNMEDVDGKDEELEDG